MATSWGFKSPLGHDSNEFVEKPFSRMTKREKGLCHISGDGSEAVSGAAPAATPPAQARHPATRSAHSASPTRVPV